MAIPLFSVRLDGLFDCKVPKHEWKADVAEWEDGCSIDVL